MDGAVAQAKLASHGPDTEAALHQLHHSVGVHNNAGPALRSHMRYRINSMAITLDSAADLDKMFHMKLATILPVRSDGGDSGR